MTLRYLTAGESHGPALVAIAEGFPAGLAVDFDEVNRDLARRQKGYGRGGRMKIEKDEAQFLAGLRGHEPRLPGVAFRAGQVALDMVYGDTAFARAARAAGARLVTGEQILVRQGALAFTLWTGQPAPEAEMAAALAVPAGSFA